MKVLVDVKRVVTTNGIVHLKLMLGGVAYTPEGDDLDDSVEVVVEDELDAQVCEREALGFAEVKCRNRDDYAKAHRDSVGLRLSRLPDRSDGVQAPAVTSRPRYPQTV